MHILWSQVEGHWHGDLTTWRTQLCLPSCYLQHYVLECASSSLKLHDCGYNSCKLNDDSLGRDTPCFVRFLYRILYPHSLQMITSPGRKSTSDPQSVGRNEQPRSLHSTKTHRRSCKQRLHQYRTSVPGTSGEGRLDATDDHGSSRIRKARGLESTQVESLLSPRYCCVSCEQMTSRAVVCSRLGN